MDVVIPFPDIGPTLFTVGPWDLWFFTLELPIRYYALGYVIGIVFGWWYALRLMANASLWTAKTFGGKAPLSKADVEDFIIWVTIGIILGGRLGYVLFYGLVYETQAYVDNPLLVFMAWEGGMSFHGGLIGVVLSVVIFARVRRIDMMKLGDIVALCAPVGIFVVRVANFINGELWGKPSDVSWAMIFPHDPLQVPRHPSQLYEALLEGVVLFIVLNLMMRVWRAHEKPGLLIGWFLALYGLFRIVVEAFFRDSDQIFWSDAGITMGQALSVPMWIAAGFFFWYALRRPAAVAQGR